MFSRHVYIFGHGRLEHSTRHSWYYGFSGSPFHVWTSPVLCNLTLFCSPFVCCSIFFFPCSISLLLSVRCSLCLVYVRSTKHSTLLGSLLLCFSNSTLWIIPCTVRKAFRPPLALSLSVYSLFGDFLFPIPLHITLGRPFVYQWSRFTNCGKAWGDFCVSL